FHAFSMKPQKDHSTGNSGSSAAGHISEAVNEGLVNGYLGTLHFLLQLFFVRSQIKNILALECTLELVHHDM
ncbi:hypothetical protein KW505_13005, partial [Vibrio fluvialis]|nr:hypothetical protein [Vibrio fluvialis]